MAVKTLVTPAADGSLILDDHPQAWRFDFGNRFLYCTASRTTVLRLLFTEGIDAGGWHLTLRAGGIPVHFSHGTACGRLLTLQGSTSGAHLRLTTTVTPETAAVIQHLEVSVEQPTTLHITVTLQPPTPAKAAVLHRAAHWIPLRWQHGGAKQAKPQTVSNLSVTPSGAVTAATPRPVTWGATLPPQQIHQLDDGSLAFLYSVEVEEHATWSWACCLGDLATLSHLLQTVQQTLVLAQQHAAWLQSLLPAADPLRKSLMIAGVEAALASFKQFPYDFAGFLAGVDYAYPPRIYFRDGYWTAQVLLPLRPDLVRVHLVNLCRGVASSGACPSGVFAPHVVPPPRRSDLRWLPDHFDSPSFLVLLLAEYVAWTNDLSVLTEAVPQPALAQHRSVAAAAFAAIDYLARQDRDGDGLLEKPYRPNDWADNIRRSTWVTYDQALFAAAAEAAAYLADRLGLPAERERFIRLAGRARAALNAYLWLEEHGHFLDYMRKGEAETHLAVDTFVTLRYHLVSEDRIPRLLSSVTRLLTKDNTSQPFGDWGVMDVFPLYHLQRDLFGKSSQPYHYHNGADWPYLDGLLGSVLALHHHRDTKYVLLRWWEYALQQGWLTPVEYYSPAYPPGGFLQAWSSMPAAALLWSSRQLPPYPVPRLLDL